MYKQVGNSVYGLTAMGLSTKKHFDVKTRSYIRLKGGVLSNPVISCYTTGFTRALIGECLNNINALEGRVISATTDGFLTDVEDLEEKLLVLSNIDCLKLFREVRKELSGDVRALEVKHHEKQGIMS